MTNRDQLLQRLGKVEFLWRDLFAVVRRVWPAARQVAEPWRPTKRFIRISRALS
jgi:hypothetical protein